MIVAGGFAVKAATDDGGSNDVAKTNGQVAAGSSAATKPNLSMIKSPLNPTTVEILISNEGGVATGPFEVVARSLKRTFVEYRSPGLAASESERKTFECQSPGDLFITVDSEKKLAESNEADNVSIFVCPSPEEEASG